MALNHYEDTWRTAFSVASCVRAVGRRAGRAAQIASAAKQLSQSREANCVGLSLTGIANLVSTFLLAKQLASDASAPSPVHRRMAAATLRARIGCIAFALLASFFSGCRQVEAELSKKPRDQALPTFIPAELRQFDCPVSPSLSRPVDLQAKAWFDESIALLERRGQADIDWKQVKLLKKKAAARHYWPAVRENLQGAYAEQKLVLIERAMSAGEPEAFFMMGKLYMEGDGVEANPAKAYAFWQRAAMMSDVRAMVELGVVLSKKQNNTIGWDMVNIPVATAMLECAMKKGHGDAAVPLSDIVLQPRKQDGSFAPIADDAAEARHLAVLQEGVKLGSRAAASELVIYFLMPHLVDAHGASANGLRARYYQYLEHSFDKARPERLPNLDAAVPLPPAPLPDWRDPEDNIAGLWEAAIASPGEATVATARSSK
jgi:TPR repeat protein